MDPFSPIGSLGRALAQKVRKAKPVWSRGYEPMKQYVESTLYAQNAS